jgi:hypothetical protein
MGRVVRFALVQLAMLLVAGSAAAAEDHADELPRGFGQINVAGGVAFPTQMTPKEVCPTYTGFGPLVRLENGWSPIRRLEFGPYVSFSSHPIDSVKCGFSSSASKGDGSSDLLFSGGLGLKWRIPLAPWATLGLGATIGFNVLSLYMPGERYPGYGLDVGAVAELRTEIVPRFALVTQIGFLSQPIGVADLPPDTRWGAQEFGFVPTLFVTVGPELFFERHTEPAPAAIGLRE